MGQLLVVLKVISVKEEMVVVAQVILLFHIQAVQAHTEVVEEAQHHLTTLHQLHQQLVLKVVVELVLQLKQEMV